MYQFAIVSLLALATYKVVDLLSDVTGVEIPKVARTFLSLGIGVAATGILDYSVFAAWNIGVRAEWMGWFFTGLIVGAMTAVWHEVLGLIEGYGRRSRDEAMEIERRSPRAA